MHVALLSAMSEPENGGSLNGRLTRGTAALVQAQRAGACLYKRGPLASTGRATGLVARFRPGFSDVDTGLVQVALHIGSRDEQENLSV
jgi:hypothetical protein